MYVYAELAVCLTCVITPSIKHPSTPYFEFIANLPAMKFQRLVQSAIFKNIVIKLISNNQLLLVLIQPSTNSIMQG